MQPMPKASRKYYAVKVGREGPQIYNSWDECKENTARHPGSIHKSFTSLRAAEDWLGPYNMISDTTDSRPQGQNGTNSADSTQLAAVPSHETQTLSECVTPGPSMSPGSQPPIEVQRPPVVLSPEQLHILELVKSGGSVFFTGSAGTGKSVLLREIIAMLKKAQGHRFAITASTGIASVNIGGTTLHSWAGIGLGKEGAEKLAGMVLGKRDLRERWRDTKTLIIDEISMIDGSLFQKLEFIARKVRNDGRPFGNIQLILSGDFCQLPPVPDRRGDSTIMAFAFESEAWQRCIGKPITLTRVFRQKEKVFVDMLNSMRFGQLTPDAIDKFRNLSRPLVYDDGIEPTELFPTRAEVDHANMTRLNRINERAHNYMSQDYPGTDSNDQRIGREKMEKLLGHLIAQKEITLKVGAQVMLIKNLVQGSLVNGSVGKVVAFVNHHDAESRGVQIAQIEGEEAKPSAAAAAAAAARKQDIVWPLVEFPGYERGILCDPKEFTVDNGQGGTEATRFQVPLILAWALSIHKSQGQTLQRVKVNLRRIFEKGQAYVALSRATSMETLEVLYFDPAKVVAHPRVIQWHRELTEGRHYDDDFDEEMDNEEALQSYYAD